MQSLYWRTKWLLSFKDPLETLPIINKCKECTCWSERRRWEKERVASKTQFKEHHKNCHWRGHVRPGESPVLSASLWLRRKQNLNLLELRNTSWEHLNSVVLIISDKWPGGWGWEAGGDWGQGHTKMEIMIFPLLDFQRLNYHSGWHLRSRSMVTYAWELNKPVLGWLKARPQDEGNIPRRLL